MEAFEKWFDETICDKCGCKTHIMCYPCEEGHRQSWKAALEFALTFGYCDCVPASAIRKELEQD